MPTQFFTLAKLWTAFKGRKDSNATVACYIDGSLKHYDMAIIKANLRFRLDDKLEIDGDIEDHSQIQYFDFEAWKEGPETKFLNVGSTFVHEDTKYEIVRILTNLMVWSPANATGDQVNSKSELYVFYYVKEVDSNSAN